MPLQLNDLDSQILLKIMKFAVRVSLELVWAGKESRKAIEENKRANARRFLPPAFLSKTIHKNKSFHVINNSITTIIFVSFGKRGLSLIIKKKGK